MAMTADAIADTIRTNLLERWLWFMEFASDALPVADYPDQILYIVRNSEPLSADFGSGSKTYSPVPARIRLDSSEPDRPPQALMEIGAFEEAIAAVRTLAASGKTPTLTIRGVLERNIGMSPVPVEKLSSGKNYRVRITSTVIELPLSPSDLSDRANSRHRVTPNTFPAAFGISAEGVQAA